MSANNQENPQQPELNANPEVTGRDVHFSILSKFPPTGLLLLAIVSIQVGASLATHLFPSLGADGTVAVRVTIAAILLALSSRHRIRFYLPIFTANWKLLLAYGLCMAAMNFFFYKAIDLIPLGAAVALEFIGPLGVAVFNSRKASHFAWVGLAITGIALLSPFTGADLDIMGVVYALLAGAGWAMFILLTKRVSLRIKGNDGLIIGMIVAALSLLPYTIPATPVLFSDYTILLAAFAVALLSTSLPFAFEFEALKTLPSRNYGVMVSVEPAVATIAGAVLLGQFIGLQGTIAIACVVIAAIGITLSGDDNVWGGLIFYCG